MSYFVLFLLLYMSSFPHRADHFIKPNWLGCAWRVLKAYTYTLKVIHFGDAPVAVREQMVGCDDEDALDTSAV